MTTTTTVSETPVGTSGGGRRGPVQKVENARGPLARGTTGVLKWVILLALLVVQVYPIFWVLSASLSTPEDIASRPPYALPSHLTLENFASAFAQSDLVRHLLNSVVIAALTIAFTVLLGAPAAYAISLLRFRGGKWVMNFFMVGLMVPVFVSLLPLFQVFNHVGLGDTYWAVILPQIAFNLPMCIYLYTGFMRSMPTSLLEAASLDGASSWRVFRSIVLPMCNNTTVTVIIYNFVFVWNEFVFANTFLTSSTMKTLPVGLNDFAGLYGQVDLGATYAAIVFAVAPTLIVYFFLNKRVISGMTAGAVK